MNEDEMVELIKSVENTYKRLIELKKDFANYKKENNQEKIEHIKASIFNRLKKLGNLLWNRTSGVQYYSDPIDVFKY